jgi:methyltransferase
VRILLIWPQNDQSVLSDELSCCEPLPFEYLAGALRPHHDVVVHDVRLDGPLSTAALDGPPGLVGIAVPYTTALRPALELARGAKALWPDVPLVVGGHHPTVSKLWLERFPADYVIGGEGGAALRQLAEDLERGIRPSPPARQALRSLDDLPPPDRSVTRRHRLRYFHSIYRPVALVRFSAGCPYECNFCILWRLTGKRYLTKRTDSILRELTEVGVDNVYVVDDEAFIQVPRMFELADALESAGIRKRFHMYVRADTAARNPALMERWADVGLHSVLIGAESANDDDLLDYHKAAHVSDTAEALRLFQRLGVKVRANFIVRPDYVDDDFDRLADTVARLRVDLPSFSVLTPLPGTALYEERQHELLSEDPDLFDCYHTLFPTRLPLERFYGRLASVLESAAARAPAAGGNAAGVFYFSNGGAFGRMVTAIRQGHRLHAAERLCEPPPARERTTPWKS